MFANCEQNLIKRKDVGTSTVSNPRDKFWIRVFWEWGHGKALNKMRKRIIHKVEILYKTFLSLEVNWILFEQDIHCYQCDTFTIFDCRKYSLFMAMGKCTIFFVAVITILTASKFYSDIRYIDMDMFAEIVHNNNCSKTMIWL